VAGATDDLVAVAEPLSGLQRAVLVPERGNALLELMQLGRKRGVVSCGQEVPELAAALGGAVELGVDLVESTHVFVNDLTSIDIP
jgi:hypothetical protein